MPFSSDTPSPFIPYPVAGRQLADRLQATPEEMAAWIWAGPDNGGLAAYLNANELDPPPRFYYDRYDGANFDYISPLMACWFRKDDIDNFQPDERYITGKVLIERWKGQPGVQVEAFIRAKIEESRLQDLHPLTGLTQGTRSGDSIYPPLDTALFPQSIISEVERADFPNSSESDTKLKVGTSEWRIENARKAANVRHQQKGGTRDKQQQIREIWATGKYSSRDICAEQEHEALGMSFSAASKALRNTPRPKPPTT